jgi:phi13 family phage major tail protein
MPENKVIFGVRNAHYAVATELDDGTLTYSAPVRLPGATEIALDPKGDQNDFYADDVLYYTTSTNQGYEVTLTIANITREFRTDVLGETFDEVNGILTENSLVNPRKIAFLFEFDGDVRATRHCLYNCTVSKPGMDSETRTESVEPKTQEITITAAPRVSDGVVKRSTTGDTPDAIYTGWYTAVYNPTETTPAV